MKGWLKKFVLLLACIFIFTSIYTLRKDLKLYKSKVCLDKLLTEMKSYFKNATFQQETSTLEKNIVPCNTNTNWVNRNNNTEYETYSPNTVVEIHKIFQTEAYKIKLYTSNKHGKRKTVGGDSWLAKISNKFLFFSIYLLDNMDGSYQGVFSTPQAGNYSINIILEYSLCHGILDPPLDWFRKGTFQGLYQMYQPGDVDDFINKTLPTKYIQVPLSNNSFLNQCEYKLPSTCTHLNSKYGYWDNLEYKDCVKIDPLKEKDNNPTVFNLLEHEVRNTKLDTLYVYGDSINTRFFNSINKKSIFCKNLFRKCKNVFTWIYEKGKYSSEDVDRTLYDGKDFNETIFLNDIEDVFKDPTMNTNKSVFLINFGMHQITELQFGRIKKLFFLFLDFIDNLKSKLGKSAPLFIWKTITEPAQAKQYRYPRERFMTTQRARLFNEFTINEGCKRNLSMLHVYHMTSSYPNGAQDQAHYDDVASFSAEIALYNYLRSYDFEKR